MLTILDPVVNQLYYKSLRGSSQFAHDDDIRDDEALVFRRSHKEEAGARAKVVVYVVDTGIRGSHDLLKSTRTERGWTSALIDLIKRKRKRKN